MTEEQLLEQIYALLQENEHLRGVIVLEEEWRNMERHGAASNELIVENKALRAENTSLRELTNADLKLLIKSLYRLSDEEATAIDWIIYIVIGVAAGLGAITVIRACMG